MLTSKSVLVAPGCPPSLFSNLGFTRAPTFRETEEDLWRFLTDASSDDPAGRQQKEVPLQHFVSCGASLLLPPSPGGQLELQSPGIRSPRSKVPPETSTVGDAGATWKKNQSPWSQLVLLLAKCPFILLWWLHSLMRHPDCGQALPRHCISFCPQTWNCWRSSNSWCSILLSWATLMPLVMKKCWD